MDILREFHLGMSCYISGFACEIGNSILTLICVYVCGFSLEWGYYGILAGVFLGQSLGFLLYYINYKFSRSFAQYHKLSADSDNSKKLSDNLSENERQDTHVSDSKSTETDENLNQFDSWFYYLKFCSTFSMNYFLENCWLRLDMVVASFALQIDGIAALSAFYNVCVMFDCFSYGFGFVTTS